MKLAIDLGGSNIRIAQIENDEILEKRSVACPSDKDEAEVLAVLIQLIRELMNDSVTGIGIGVPSIVDVEKGIVYNAANISSWKAVPLKEILQNEFSVPVAINNDSNCFALGEKLFGQGRAYPNMIGITLGTGVGAGVIINNELYCGRNACSGEVGSLPYLDADFETYCSTPFFAKQFGLTGKEAADRALQGDAQALQMWDEFGHHLGNLMKALLFSYDPHAIIIGGGISTAFPLYEKSMRKAMSDFPYHRVIEKIHIETSINQDIGILGASALL